MQRLLATSRDHETQGLHRLLVAARRVWDATRPDAHHPIRVVGNRAAMDELGAMLADLT